MMVRAPGLAPDAEWHCVLDWVCLSLTENKSLTGGNSSEDGGVYVLVSLGLAGSGPQERELEKYQGKVGWKIL